MIELLVLSREEIIASVDMLEAVTACESAYRSLSAGEAVVPVRVPVDVKKHGGTTLFMPCHLPAVDSTGVKVVSVYPDNPVKGLPTIAALMVMVDAVTGVPAAIMEAAYLTALRTGASSAAASRYLARPDSRVASILGAGVQGRTQIEGLVAVLPIEEARVFDVVHENALGFARDMSSKLGIKVEAVKNADECVDGADVIACATTSRTPVFHGDRLKAGAHVNGIGSFTSEMQEVGEDTLARADMVVVDSMWAAMEEAGDLLIPMKRGTFKKSDVYGEIGEIMLGRKPGRRDPSQTTFFKAVGVSVLDVAVADLIHRRAKEKGFGTTIAL